jgi:hypothetical protein
MALPISIDTAFIKQYAAVFEHLFQQTTSELRSTVRNESQNAEMKFWDFIGPTSVTWDLPRGSDTPNIPTPFSRRKCLLRRANWGEFIDDFDRIQMLKDPTSDDIKNAVNALHRAIDERILEGLGADVSTGKEGTTTVHNYDVGECRLMEGDGTLVTAGSDHSDTTETPLTIAKLADIGKILDDASVPSQGRHFVANPYNKWQLLQTTEVKSYDYNTVKALANGEIDTFMNFKFHWLPTERFTVNATDTGTIECYAWHNSAMLLSVGKDIVTNVDRVPHKLNSVLAQAEMFIGAVRLQGPGVIEVLLKYA